MNDLAIRIEALTAPDRRLDIEALVAIDWKPADWELGEPTVRGMVERHGLDWMMGRQCGMSIWQRLPRLTASVDAALSIIPPGWQIGTMTRPVRSGSPFNVTLDGFTVPFGVAGSKGAPLFPCAITAAALRVWGMIDHG